jgi:7-cyano-7-deazaguanine synthase
MTPSGPNERPPAVVLMSGGLDSCVATAIAHRDYDLFALHASYGQKTQARERVAFDAQAEFFEVRDRRVIGLGYLGTLGGSSLTDPGMEVPEGDLDREGIPTTYVPFRNAHFIAAAVSWAEVLGAERIFIGAVEEDSSGYPDCRPAYYEAFNRLIEVGTRPETHIRVETPLIRMRKADIVRKGLELGAPLSFTWSCYRSAAPACGRCDSCLLRLRAFMEAGRPDPISYANPPQYEKIYETGGVS